ncbi:MAG: DivIVA domain-containing protein [Oscillospiraceae bacterium]|jgi:DivIVA domain-containing protein|nr:DivIVA domain-containing protein [Oscillospiraceae bacterium]
MLEPRDIRTHRFAQVRQGYKPEEVDAFLSQAAEAYEQTRQELEQLRALAEQTAESLKQCIAERDSISRVLAKAEVMADNIRKDANDEARSLISTADREAKDTLREARQKADETIREATLTAQDRLKKAAETADKVEVTARERAENVERAAEQKAYAALHSLEDQRAAIRREADELAALSARFKLEMVNAYEHQLRVLRQLPDNIALTPEPSTEPIPSAKENDSRAAQYEEQTEPKVISVCDTPVVTPIEEEPIQPAPSSGRYSGYFAE